MNSASGWAGRSSALAAALLLLLAGLPASVQAKVFHSRKQAVALAFPEADRIEEKTHMLRGGQADAVQELARARVESRLITVYTGWKGEELLGYALIDVHTVRTLPEAFMIVLSPEGEVRSLRVLAFYEPQEYLPPERWLAQFEQKRLSEDLRLRGEIHGIAGSTLSARAVTSGVRRALALYEVLLRGSEVARREPGGGP